MQGSMIEKLRFPVMPHMKGLSGQKDTLHSIEARLTIAPKRPQISRNQSVRSERKCTYRGMR